MVGREVEVQMSLKILIRRQDGAKKDDGMKGGGQGQGVEASRNMVKYLQGEESIGPGPGLAAPAKRGIGASMVMSMRMGTRFDEMATVTANATIAMTRLVSSGDHQLLK